MSYRNKCNLPISCESGISTQLQWRADLCSTKELSVLYQHCSWQEREPWTANSTNKEPLHTNRSVVIRTRLEPERNSLMIRSLSFWSMSPCWKDRMKSYNMHWKFPHLYQMCQSHKEVRTRAETVKSLACIFSVSQSTFLLVLMKITACVMVKVSYKSHKVSSFHSWGPPGQTVSTASSA